MKYFKRNKWTIIAIVILIVLVFVGVQVKKLLVPDEGKAAYGDRLDSIKNHKIKDKVLEDIKTALLEKDNISKVDYKVHGKIINLTITVSDDVSIADAKTIGNSTITMFEDDELKYYSLQVFLRKEDTKLNNFPIIGYKGIEASELSFTKDRDIVSEE